MDCKVTNEVTLTVWQSVARYVHVCYDGPLV